MSSIQAQQRHVTQTLGQFPELTPVQRVFPDPFPGASDITPPLGKASLPLLRSKGDRFGSPILLPLQLSDDLGGIGGLKTTPREREALPDKLQLGGEHVLLLNELA